MRGDEIPTVRGKQVKIPLLPNIVGKRSRTMTMVTTYTSGRKTFSHFTLLVIG